MLNRVSPGIRTHFQDVFNGVVSESDRFEDTVIDLAPAQVYAENGGEHVEYPLYKIKGDD